MTGSDPLATLIERKLIAESGGPLAMADTALGGLHRLAWVGPDPLGDRARLHKYVRSLIRTTDTELPAVSAIFDWWRVVTFGVAPERRAREIGAILGGPTGEALQAFIDLPMPQPLARLRQSYAATAMMAQLDMLLAEPVAAKVAPAARILKDARAQCAEVLRAARALEPRPQGARVLGLTEASAQDWAATTGPEGSLKRGSTVFHTTVESLLALSERLEVVLAGWPADAPPAPILPETWRKDVKEATSPHNDVPMALIADLLPEPTYRPVFAPNPRKCPEVEDDATLKHRVFVLALFREAFEATKTPYRLWMRETLLMLEERRKLVRSLRAEIGPYADQAAKDAERHLDDFEMEELDERIAAMQMVLSGRKLYQSRQEVIDSFRRFAAQLKEVGEDVPAEPAALRRPYKDDPIDRPPEEPKKKRRRKGDPSPLPLDDELFQDINEESLEEAAAEAEIDRMLASGSDDDKIIAAFCDPVWPKADRERAMRWGRTVRDRFNAALERRVARLRTLENGLLMRERRPSKNLGEVHALIYPKDKLKVLTLQGFDERIAHFQAIVDELSAEEDPTLDEDLLALRERLILKPESWNAMGLFSRLLHRRKLGLDVTQTRGMVETLDALAKSPPDPPLAAICYRHEGRVFQSATVLGGAPGIAIETRTPREIQDGLLFVDGTPADAEAQVATWAWVGDLKDVPRHAARTVFVREGQDLNVGPWRLTPAGLAPTSSTGEVFELDNLHTFGIQGEVSFLNSPGKGGRREDDPGESWLLSDTLSEDELRSLAQPRRDGAGPGWVFAHLSASLDTDQAERLARWLNDPTPAKAAVMRLDRLDALLERAEVFEPLRAEARRGSKAALALRATLDQEQAEAQTALDTTLAEERAAALGPLAEALTTLQAARAPLVADLTALEEELATLDALLADPRLGALARALPAPAAPVPAKPPAAPPAPLRAARGREVAAVTLQQAIWRVAGQTWAFEDVANLLIAMLTGRWTLLAGLPGVGKSTFARSVLTRLGHGPATGRTLELVVRRDWQDDAPLFGFWHPTERRWEPSSEGLLEHLLRAQDDTRQQLGGLYPVLIEELNLASPAHYLARLLSATEARPPRLRLYGPDLHPENAARYPSSFDLPPSARLVATVNVDDTVERLSPRFLSRASVIWIEPRAGAPRWRPEDDLIDAPPVSLPALLASVDRPPAALGTLEGLIEHLRGLGLPGAPSRRSIAAIRRALAASEGVLPRLEAEDQQLLQRVLPPLRGVGPKWRAVLDELSVRLEAGGWRRSAAHTRGLRERGEALGDWYDLFHT
jgi:uncharacterized small protein (DUF1192 family)